MEKPLTQTVPQFEVVTDIEVFLSLQQEWEELWQAAQGTPFQLFRYCLHVLREVAIPTGASLCCIVGRKGGRMIFAWPLIRYREYLWMTVRPLAPDTSEPSDVLVAAGEDADSLVSAGWSVLVSSGGIDIINLPMVRQDSALHRFLLRPKRLSRGERRVIGVARLMQYRTWAEYRGTLADSFRKRQDYDRRRLLKAGDTKFFSAPDNPSGAAYVQTMLAWKNQWAARVGAVGDFFKEPYQNFLRKIAADPSFGQSFRVFVLTLNGEAIAVNLVAISTGVVVGMQTAYDPAYAKYTPGSLLLEYVLEWAFENRRNLDFGSGDSKYKSNWTGGLGYMCTDFRIGVSRWGRTAFAARALQRHYESLPLRIASGPVGRALKIRRGKKADGPPSPRMRET
jgi:CelD/BcsL family acetyltransferase involved in cellulose biosynthesis